MEGLQVKPEGRYVDATVGEGGHTSAILEKGGYVLGLDRNKEQIMALQKGMNNDHLTLVEGNFADIAKLVPAKDKGNIDGILFDLGLSWAQLKDLGRGLSYRNLDEPLDMRLDQSGELTAEYILNVYSEDELYEVFAKNSEEVKAKEIAESIVNYRTTKRYKKVLDLNNTIDKVMGANAGKTYSRIYQALRIEVNEEFENLKKGLDGALSVLKPGGKIAVISFHSLEDRIVKNFIREKKLKQITKKAIAGDRQLSFERSAHLRIFSS
ncbi:16S rRNA (cytosine(1402)-N(4))-methyltransferase RsmH [Candidatus Roizmanbacteria bacterium]|nr:16S rRNA (cytosine(1402)-N(4))-methyltransferase RsmH [Candidatus Roizmanbacteria bacterium]